MKQKRHRAILEIIQKHNVDTQEELSERLREVGFHVTQATISRDIKELHLIKVQAEKGLMALENDNFKVVILRPPMIYGKGSKGNYPILSKLAQKFPLFPSVRNERSMLYVGNLVEFVRLMIENEEQGIFWPQNKEYINTSEMVKMIAALYGKKVRLVKGFGWFLKIMSHFTGLVNKAFGNLIYEKSMSEYKEEYRKVSLAESIKGTERNE